MLEVIERFQRVWRVFRGVGEVLEAMERFWRGWRGCAGVRRCCRAFWRFWGALGRSGGGAEAGFGAGAPPGGAHDDPWAHPGHVSSPAPPWAVPPPCLAREQRFPRRDEQDRGLWGQRSAESVEMKSSVTENPPGDPTGSLSPKLLVEAWGQLQPHRGFILPAAGV